MKTFAVFCPGPSLRFIINPSGYDGTIAVNMALKLMTADWFSAGDSAFYKGLIGHFRPKKGCIIPDTVFPEVENRGSWRESGWRLWSLIPLIDEHKKRGRPINWSLQAALCFAASQGADHVDIYGCDLTGTEDATGYVGEDRTADRWAREADDLKYTRKLLAEHGITTARVGQHV